MTTDPPPATLTPASAPHRYLALGDSYTIGQSVSVNVRLPVQLTKALRARGIAMDDALVIAQTGWTTDELATAIERVKPPGTFDLVTLLIGVNNQFRGYEIDQYQVEFRDLLQRSIAFAGGDATHVIVVSIPDWGATPFAGGRDEQKVAAEIDAFNAINRAEAKQAGARYVNVTDISRLVIEDSTLIARDGLHPSGKMYTLWVGKILIEALEILKK